jgi:DNA polymerase I
MNEVFVAFVIDRFELGALSMTLKDADDLDRHIKLTELSGYPGTVVTHDVSLLIRTLRHHQLGLPAVLIDIAEALRLVSQLSMDQGGEKHWDTWKRASAFAAVPADTKQIARLLDARSSPPPQDELDRLTISAVNALSALWGMTVAEMEDKSELARFQEIEVPVQQIFHSRELVGLRVDGSVIAGFVKACENEKYSLFRKIASHLGYSPLGIRDGRLANLLLDSWIEHPDGVTEGLALENWLDLASFRSQPASILRDYIKSKRDLTVLREANAIEGRIYPEFYVHGTVTSRILVSEPRLQQLRKRFRSIVAADQGYELCYLDYAQFEPAILAVLSEDLDLQAAYRSGDMYLALARALYEEDQNRDIAKRVFLGFLYGMSKKGIGAFLEDHDSASTSREQYEEIIGDFFDKFQGVETFRKSAQISLAERRQVGTSLGNKRRRLSDNNLTRKEERWAMNHIIQGTASLIFKRALIEISQRFGREAILLPMHDAVLLQFRPAEMPRAIFEEECSVLMQKAFRAHCPGLVVRVTSASF